MGNECCCITWGCVFLECSRTAGEQFWNWVSSSLCYQLAMTLGKSPRFSPSPSLTEKQLAHTFTVFFLPDQGVRARTNHHGAINPLKAGKGTQSVSRNPEQRWAKPRENHHILFEPRPLLHWVPSDSQDPLTEHAQMAPGTGESHAGL